MDNQFYSDNTTLPELIKIRRQQLNYTQSELGVILGYKSGNFITMIESGKSVFPIARWRDYARALAFPEHLFLKTVIRELYPEMLDYLAFHPPGKKIKRNAIVNI